MTSKDLIRTLRLIQDRNEQVIVHSQALDDFIRNLLEKLSTLPSNAVIICDDR